MKHHMHKNEVKAVVLEYLYSHRPQSFTTKKLFYKCQISNENASIYNKAIKEIILAEYIIQSDNEIRWNERYFIGKCFIFGKTFYSYLEKDKYRLSIPMKKHPLDGDTVIVKITAPIMLEADLIEILYRTSKNIQGTLVSSNQKNSAFVIPDDHKRYPTDIYIGSGQPTSPLEYCKVEVSINKYETDRKPCGTILRMIRHTLEDAQTNGPAIMSKYGLMAGFPKSICDAAIGTSTRISKNAYEDRTSIEDKIILFDDVPETAFSITKRNGLFNITVSVPDVAHYVQTGGALDTTAKKRVSTVLASSIRYPLLPQELESRICFRTEKKILAVSIAMTFQEDGQLIQYETFESIVSPSIVIKSGDIEQYMSDPSESFEDEYSSVINEVIWMKEFLETQDTELSDIFINSRKAFHQKFVSRLKALYNMIFAIISQDQKLPVIYCQLPPPDEFDIHRLTIQCETVGMPKQENDADMEIEQILDFANVVAGKSIRKAIYEQLRQSMQMPIYSNQAGEYHVYGIDAYAEVSDPVNKYADIFNQRVFKQYIRKRIRNFTVLDDLNEQLKSIPDELNKKMRAVAEVTKEIIGFIQSEQVLKSSETQTVGTAFKVTPSGVYVLLKNGTIGLAKAANHTLSDRIFEYETENGWKKIVIGDKISINYDRYDIKSKKLIFTIC